MYTYTCYTILRRLVKKGSYEKFLPQDVSRSRVILNKRIRHLKIGFPKAFKGIGHHLQLDSAPLGSLENFSQNGEHKYTWTGMFSCRKIKIIGINHQALGHKAAE